MTDQERETHQRIVKELEARLQLRPVNDLTSKLSEVLGKLHVINSEAGLLVNFTNDPNLRPKERGVTIQKYRLVAHGLICEVIDGIRTQPSLSDAIKEVEKMRDEWFNDPELGDEVSGFYMDAGQDIIDRLNSLGTQRED